jgi:molecular chaperone GrpE
MTEEQLINENQTAPEAQAHETETANNSGQNGADIHETEPIGEEPLTDAERIQQLQAKLTVAQAKADEYLDHLQRTVADFQNSRRRQERQLAEEIERANASLIRRLLPILDDLNLAFQNIPAALNPAADLPGAEEDVSIHSEIAWVEGFRQIQKKLYTLFEEQGVVAIPMDGAFDTARHEAISSEPSEAVESGQIIETVRAGYEYKGRVLRPALVRIAL